MLSWVEWRFVHMLAKWRNSFEPQANRLKHVDMIITFYSANSRMHTHTHITFGKFTDAHLVVDIIGIVLSWFMNDVGYWIRRNVAVASITSKRAIDQTKQQYELYLYINNHVPILLLNSYICTHTHKINICNQFDAIFM